MRGGVVHGPREACSKSLARAAGSFSSIRFLLATVCCCTNSILSGRRCWSYSLRMSSGASRRMTLPSSSLQLDRVVDAEVQTQPAERVVDVCGIAGKEHAALAEAGRHALVYVVEVAVDNIVRRCSSAESAAVGASVAAGLINSSSVCSGRVEDKTRQSGPLSSPLTLNIENQDLGSET